MTVRDPAHSPTRSPGEVVRRWWPALLALLLSIATQLDGTPWGSAAWTTWLLPALPLAYLVFGALRGRLGRPGVLAIQLAGLVAWIALMVLALVSDPVLGRYLVAAGWFAHAIWDVAHHRDLNRNRCTGVVPRWYAEVCVVFDLMVGTALLGPLAAGR